jgi:alpha-1,2-mannosyltransferase
LSEGQSVSVAVGVGSRAAGVRGARWAAAGGAAALAASLAVLCALYVRGGSLISGMIDLRVYQAGGLVALHSGNIYGSAFASRLYFTYPPLAALAFSTVATLPMATLRWLLTGANIGALIATMWLTTGMLGHRRPAARLGMTLAAAAIALWLQPVWQTFSFGQVNLILMFIIMADLRLPDSAWFKGAGVGFAAGFKLTPLIFIPYLLLTGRIRAAGVAFGTFMLTIAMSAIALPGPSRQYWLGLLFLDSNRTGNTAYVGNQSLYGMLARLLGSPAAARPYWAATAVVIGVAGLLIAARWSRRGQELPGILTCALTGLLVCPVSWEHHWVWAAPAIVLAADAVARLWRPGEVAPAFPGGPRRAALLRHRWAWLAAAALLAVPFFADPPSIVPASAVQGYGDHGTQLLAGNIYVIAGLVILGLAGLALADSRRAALPPRDGTAGGSGGSSPRAGTAQRVPEQPRATV